MTTRRTFLQQSLTVAGGIVATQTFGGIPFLSTKPRVIVLGAGIAGLSAADTLVQAGAEVTVLEARKRLGGRIFSYSPAEAKGLVMELGAEWIGEDHTTMRGLCDRFGLPLQDNRFAVHMVDRGAYKAANTWDFTPAWKERWEKLLDGFNAMSPQEQQQLDNIDFYHYLLMNGCDGPDLEWMELNDSTEFGESIRHVSAYMAMGGHAAAGEHAQMDYKMKGGNGMVIEALAGSVGLANIHQDHRASHVEQDGDGVKVTCTNGSVWTADKIICTLPVFAMRHIEWKPGLPTDLRQALQELNYGRINKHAVMYDRRFWKDEDFAMVTDMPAHFFYHATKDQASDAGILISYSIGDKAAIFGSYSDVKSWSANAVNEALKPAFGDTSKHLLHQWNYNWSTDEYSRGAYAIYNKYQWFKLRPVLERPFMNTHFAGEHLHDWQGFMEGAAESGIASANMILG